MPLPTPPLRLTIAKPGGIIPVVCGIVISVLLYVIVLWPDGGSLATMIFGPLVFIPLFLSWVGVRRRSVEIDPARHTITPRLELFGWTVRRKQARQPFSRIVVDGDPLQYEVALLSDWGARRTPRSTGFTIFLEGPRRRIPLDQVHDPLPAEARALVIAKAANLPAIRRGYYPGPPRPGTINRIHSEAVWQLALTGQAVITGDPADTGPIESTPPQEPLDRGDHPLALPAPG